MLACVCLAICIISNKRIYGQYFSNCLADLDNIGMVLGVIENAEFISEIFKIRNGS